MAFTYSKLAEATVGSGGSAIIAFNNIPQNYTDLALKLSLRVDSGSGYYYSRARMQINSTTSGYSNTLLYNLDGTVASATGTDYITYFYSVGTASTSNTFASTDIYIPNYAGSSNKSVSSDSAPENNGTQILLGLNAGLLSNPVAIVSLAINDTNGFNFSQHSTATLYGVKAEV
jgi:hypothetical protein